MAIRKGQDAVHLRSSCTAPHIREEPVHLRGVGCLYIVSPLAFETMNEALTPI